MSRDKQIEEMANIIKCKAEQLPRCPHTTCSSCKATELYNEGYRKASEVAREIFEVIEEGIESAVYALQFNNNPIHRNAKHEAYSSLMCFIKTIEEEYTEDGKRKK